MADIRGGDPELVNKISAARQRPEQVGIEPCDLCDLCHARPAAMDGSCQACWQTLARFDCGVITQDGLILDLKRRSLFSVSSARAFQ